MARARAAGSKHSANLSQQAVGEVMDMVSNGKPLPPHIADAVRAYGGLRPFIESELIKNNVKVDDARRIARDQPAEFYEVELEEDAPAVQEVSMVDRLVGGSIALVGAMLPGAPAQATVLPPPPITGHCRPMDQGHVNRPSSLLLSRWASAPLIWPRPCHTKRLAALTLQ